MLHKDVFFKKMDELVVTYPNWKLKFEDAEVMKLWYSKFRNMTDEQFTQMVENYIENESFNPTVAGLKKWDTMPRKSAVQIRHEQALKEYGYYDRA